MIHPFFYKITFAPQVKTWDIVLFGSAALFVFWRMALPFFKGFFSRTGVVAQSGKAFRRYGVNLQARTPTQKELQIMSRPLSSVIITYFSPTKSFIYACISLFFCLLIALLAFLDIRST